MQLNKNINKEPIFLTVTVLHCNRVEEQLQVRYMMVAFSNTTTFEPTRLLTVGLFPLRSLPLSISPLISLWINMTSALFKAHLLRLRAWVRSAASRSLQHRAPVRFQQASCSSSASPVRSTISVLQFDFCSSTSIVLKFGFSECTPVRFQH